MAAGHRASRLPLDARCFQQDCDCVATRKPAQFLKEVPTKGTALAAKYRARANALTDEERQRHRAHAMSLIYGNPHGPAAHARSR